MGRMCLGDPTPVTAIGPDTATQSWPSTVWLVVCGLARKDKWANHILSLSEAD